MAVNKVRIVDERRFVQATRDSGYRDLDAAVSELVDNALQANARTVRIVTPLGKHPQGSWSLAVLDDGSGMTRHELGTALQFGGSHRFNDRTGLGRFGMGLPNSSLSQARRVDVYSWMRRGAVWHSYLDLDEILFGHCRHVPMPARAALPEAFRAHAQVTGTLVLWSRFDRLCSSSGASAIRRLELRLGQRFRYFIWGGHRILINDVPVVPFDPLFLSGETRVPCVRGKQYGDTLVYGLATVGGEDGARTARVQVRFSEIPVPELAGLTKEQKRLYGISSGAGVSIVRAGREIDYGWFFMDKRRENYDDWWRCEVSFAPELDELFGVAHTKQGIRPSDRLRSLLTPQLGSIARLLNHRARRAHMTYAAQNGRESASVASKRDGRLRPTVHGNSALGGVAACKGQLPGRQAVPEAGLRQYAVEMQDIHERVFYRAEAKDGNVVLVLNNLHEFAQRLYSPLVAGDTSDGLAVKFQLFLLALARSENLNWTDSERDTIQRFKHEWSRAVSVFLRGA